MRFIGIPGLLSACLILVSCASAQPRLARVSSISSIDTAYIATDAEFGKYDRLLAEDMHVFLPQHSRASAQDLKRIRQEFRSAFISELHGYAVVPEAGFGTMKVQALLIDLRNASGADIPDIRSDLRGVAAPGELLFLMELRDSATNRVLARAADSAASRSFAALDGGTTDWNSVETTIQNWVVLFRQFLDQYLAR